MRSAVQDAAASASSVGPGTTSGVTAAVIAFSSSCSRTTLESLQRSGQRLLEEDIVARQRQLDAQQFLGCARFQTHGSLGKLLIAKPDLRGEPAASKPAHAETGGALIATGVDQEAVDTVL